ncbi:NAD(P)-dependent oxidoreductase [Patescibacteria group bacterium]
MRHKILNTIGEKYTKKAQELLHEHSELDCLDLTQEELVSRINGYSILLVGLGLNVDKNVINKGKSLKIIATATTGLDHIDVDFATKKGIEIISLREETDFLNTITGTAELAFGLMLDLMRQTHSAFDSVKKYQWDRESFRGHNLYGQTLGIVGLGRLGGWMAKYGQAFNMNIISFDPKKDQQYFDNIGVKKAEFEELLSQSDVISIHVHLKENTENMFGRGAFSKMKNTAYLINTSRGKIVNEEDLFDALESKKIAGYATDVLADELDFDKGFSEHPLVEYSKNHDNLIIVPHIGGMTHESREATDIFIAEKILKTISLLTG